MRRKAFSIIELLVVVAVIAILSAILFPVFSEAANAAQRKSNTFNLKRLSLVANHYSDDYDGQIPIISNGNYRSLKNTADGVLTAYGEQRTDMWPLILLPYSKDRRLYVDPERGDAFGVYSAPALATSDPGYDPYANTFRNQSRFSMFAVNYLFLSPLLIPSSKLSDASPTDFMVGQAHSFSEAEDPAGTVFYTESARGYVPTTTTDTLGTLDSARGFFAVNAPGLWDVLVQESATPIPIPFWNGSDCSGDWCGADIDPGTPGVQTRENFFYKNPATLGNNVLFLDGHVTFRTAAALAAGTDYLTATPSDGGSGAFGGGAHITDKDHYLWNLGDNYYGA